MARYRRYIRKSFKKRNSDRVIRAGSSKIVGQTQQIAYTYTAPEACTVKSIKLDVGATTASSTTVPDTVALPYVLVVVPEGYDANAINYPALSDDMYNPTNLVLISGILTDQTSEDHKYNMIGRKLKKGDRLALVFRNPQEAAVGTTVSFEINFSIMT